MDLSLTESDRRAVVIYAERMAVAGPALGTVIEAPAESTFDRTKIVTK